MSKFLEKLKKESERLRKDAESRGGGYEKTDWYKCDMGDNLIRILPYGEELPYLEANVHYVPITKKTGGTVNIPLRCPGDFEEDCPLCNAYDKMVKKDKDKARKMLRRRVFLYNVLVYKPPQKVQPWAAGQQVQDKIWEYAGDLAADDCNVFDTEAGRDWKLIKKKDPRIPGNLGISYDIRPGSKNAPVPEKVAHLLDGAVDLSTLYARNEDDLKKMKEFLGESDEEMYEEEEDLPEVKAPAASAARAKAAAAAAKAKPAATAKPAASKPAAKAKPAEEEDSSFEEEEDLGVDSEDDDLEAELRELGV